MKTYLLMRISALNAACACRIAKNQNENESPRCRMVLIQAWASHHLKVAHPVELIARQLNILTKVKKRIIKYLS